MQYVAVDEGNGSRLSDQRFDPVLSREPFEGGMVDMVQGVASAGGVLVEAGVEEPVAL